MTCPPACLTSGMCVRACAPTAGPVCTPCQEACCDDCEVELWDPETGEPTICHCCGIEEL